MQRRNCKTNAGIAAFPVLLCVLLVAIQTMVDRELGRPPFQCGCACVLAGSTGACERTECGVQYSTPTQALSCEVPAPPRWPALVQVPAVPASLRGLPTAPCTSANASEPCGPVAVLLTGQNRGLSQSLGRGLFPAIAASDYLRMSSGIMNSSECRDELSKVVPGSSTLPAHVLFVEPGLVPNETLYVIQPKCSWPPRNVSTSSDGMPIDVGYDFLDTSKGRFHVDVSYNSTFSRDNGHHSMTVLRVARLVNMASTAYLKVRQGANAEMRLEFLKEMPKAAIRIRLDLTTLLAALFFTWTVQLLLPVILTYLVYEKQQKLRLMMKMHGLKDGPYWLITYFYFLALSAAYMILFVLFGSFIGLEIFRSNSYGIQFLFFFIYINLQIVFAILLASFFSSVKTASVISYIYVFGSSLLGEALLKLFIEDATFPRLWLVIMELVPGFSLYRGFYELAEYAASGSQKGKSGMQWGDLNDPVNGMKDVLVLMSIEWILMLPLAFLLDHRPAWHPLFLFGILSTKHSSPTWRPDKAKQLSSTKIFADMIKDDVFLERKVVKRLLMEMDTRNMIICHNLKKVYRGKNGNPDKLAVRGLSLALRKGQCFGMLGPNGAGKTSFINMAVDKSLKSVNLFYCGFGDKSVNKYSGGMKRRLSVAIALIGNPKVVYMDEPSTGLDTTSRNDLWNVIKRAKKECTIILTTHSMEEAEELCDRVGIFVSGNFHCLGTPNELKARYGGTRVLTITTAVEHEAEVARLITELSPSATKIYGMSGTQKFELPKREVRLEGVFGAVAAARSRFPVQGWGVTDTTLEDVFIRVAKDARAFDVLS
ncbi:hypothetical protein ACQ4PT_064907 [Festuca glaucescens]